MHYLEFDYRITISAMNCMYSDSPKFINFEKECADIEEFLTKNYSGHILAIYSIFQGATVMTELLARNKVQIDYAFLDGLYCSTLRKIEWYMFIYFITSYMAIPIFLAIL